MVKMVAPNIQDVTLVSTDPELLLCWEQQVKQGKDWSLILKYQGGKITNTLQVSRRHKAVAPKIDSEPTSSSQDEKNNRDVKKKNKKKSLEKLLSYHQHIVNEKGLPPSRLMLQHSQQNNEQFKCDQCDFKATSLKHLEVHKNATHKAQNILISLVKEIESTSKENKLPDLIDSDWLKFANSYQFQGHINLLCDCLHLNPNPIS